MTVVRDEDSTTTRPQPPRHFTRDLERRQYRAGREPASTEPIRHGRAVARVREVTGGSLLVPAGRGLVPTPRALELRERVALVVEEAKAVLRPVAAPNLGSVTRMFTLRSREGFVENFGARLIAGAAKTAPGIRLQFEARAMRDGASLRGGTVDLETGFSTAIAIARGSDLIATVPERHTGNLRAGLHTFELPFAMPAFTLSLL